MAMDFAAKKCVPCEGGVPVLTPKQVANFLTEIPGWEADAASRKITRKWKFKDFRKAMAFVNKVAELAEAEGHHPDIHVSYSRVTLELFTHAVGGLSENDFILAAKINALT